MAAIVGIDLGTTNSVLAYLDEAGDPRILHNQQGENITPSVVSIGSDETVVGREALMIREHDPDSVVTEFKREMGTDMSYDLPGGNMTPVTLSGLLLKTLGQHALDQLGELGDVVITTPANFSNSAREATRSAGEIAGFKLGPEINEPTAAALFYSFGGNLSSGTYFIYDFGGGTWDISAVEVKDKEVQVLWSNGIARCGGRDFDEKVGELLKETYTSQTGANLDESLRTLSNEDIKKSLSTRNQARIAVRSSDGPPVSITITREQFEAKISSIISQTEFVCEDILSRYPDFIDVFLVGGSTRVPKIQESVEKIFKKAPLSVANPDEVVALGAAIYAGLKADSSDLNAAQSSQLSSVNLNEVSNHYFGTDALTMDKNTNKTKIQNTIVIPKGHEIPCSVTKEYFTVNDDQTSVDIKVTQSENPETDLDYVEIIWEGSLTVPPSRPKGQVIEVTYEYTEDERMKCSFVDVASGKRIDVDLYPKTNISESDRRSIEQFFVE